MYSSRPSSNKILNSRKRQLFRKHIPAGEAWAGAGVLVLLSVVVLWVAFQKNAFSPADRDLSYKELLQHPVADRLYQNPLKPLGSSGFQNAQAGTFQAARSQAALSLAPFPLEILKGGWALGGRVRHFSPKTLFQKINGEAEKFIRQGFKKLHYIALKGPDKENLSVELFDQGAMRGALGVFSDHRSGGRKVKQVGKALYFSTPVGAIGYTGKYFFRIAGSAETAAVKSKALETVHLIASLTGSSPPQSADSSRSPAPPVYVHLQKAYGVSRQALDYKAKNVFAYAFAKAFWFARLKGDARVFIHRAKSPQAAKALGEKIRQEHGKDYTILKQDVSLKDKGPLILMRHPFLKTHFGLAWQGAFLFGVEGFSQAGAATRALERLRETLEESSEGTRRNNRLKNPTRKRGDNGKE